MKAYFTKLPNSTLMPALDADRALLTKIKAGETVSLELKRPRNILFHRKFFALRDYLFDCYMELVDFQMSREVFRKQLIIGAGFYDEQFSMSGKIIKVPKSISFGSMSEDEFEKLYSACIDFGIKYILPAYTDAELRRVIEQGLMEFA